MPGSQGLAVVDLAGGFALFLSHTLVLADSSAKNPIRVDVWGESSVILGELGRFFFFLTS
jgi:hypothetical protein